MFPQLVSLFGKGGDVSALNKDYFKASRSLFENNIWKNIHKFRLFFYLFGNAVYKQEGKTYNGINIQRGQILKSYRKLAENLEYIENNAIKRYSISTIKRLLDELVAEERITMLGTDLGTLITIVNYEEYQCFSNHDNDPTWNGAWNTDRTPIEHRQNNNNKDNKDNKESLKDLMSANGQVVQEKKSNFKEEHLTLATLLKTKILLNKPDAKVPGNMNSWANTVRLMVEQDKRTLGGIEQVINWCQQDEFWRKNILSMDKLRKQFDRLEMQASQKGGAANGRNFASKTSEGSQDKDYNEGGW